MHRSEASPISDTDTLSRVTRSLIEAICLMESNSRASWKMILSALRNEQRRLAQNSGSDRNR